MKTMHHTGGRVYILILNWNGWKDTIECLESVFHSDYTDFRVIVCDNDSKDGSLGYIKDWADARLAASAVNPAFNYIICPPVGKPIAYAEYGRVAAENGGDKKIDHALVLIQTGGNLGFAGGNNVGLRYVEARNDAAFVWLLNNDTIITSNSLTQIVRRSLMSQQIGICGSLVRYYFQPLVTQTLGGCVYNKWFGIAKNIGHMQGASTRIDRNAVERKLDYVLGASMLISVKCLSTIGLMNESYFLYYEEIDWAVRASGKFTLAFAPDSVVYHKDGASIGSRLSESPILRYRSEYFLIRNRIKFTANHFPYAMPTVYVGL